MEENHKGKFCRKNAAASIWQRRFFDAVLHSAGDLTRTEASGAHINVLGRTIHDRLDPLHVGLPGPVGAAVGVGNLVAEHNALAAKITFRHSLLPPRLLGFA